MGRRILAIRVPPSSLRHLSRGQPAPMEPDHQGTPCRSPQVPEAPVIPRGGGDEADRKLQEALAVSPGGRAGLTLGIP